MGFLSTLMAPRADSSPFKPWDDFWYENVRGVGTAVGIPVTPTVALQVAAVFACVQVKSETLATLPLIVYKRRAGRGKDRAPEHSLYTLLHDSPNSWQTSVEFIEDMEGARVLHGGCYAEILPGSRGAVGELVPLRPDTVTLEHLDTRRVRYKVRRSDGKVDTLTQDQVFHVRGRSLDFVRGMSTVSMARDAIALARAVDLFGSKFFANDATVGLTVNYPGKMSDKTYDRLKVEFANLHGGVGNAHKPKILEEGMTLSRVPMTAARDAQLTDQQQAAVIPICQYFRIPPHKIQHLLHATFSNIEHQSIEFVTDTMLPGARRWESRINATLISDEQHFAEFLFAGLLRGDNSARASYYRERFNIGTLSINDIRELENENPLPDEIGDRYFVQGALVPVDRIDSMLDKRDEPRGALSPGRPPAPDEDEEEEEPVAAAAHSPAPPLRAFRTLIVDASERIARAEIREIEKRHPKAHENPGRFAVWLASFYGEHEVYVQRTLQPLATAWEAETGEPVAVAVMLADIVSGAYGPADDLTAWSTARASWIATTALEHFRTPQLALR